MTNQNNFLSNLLNIVSGFAIGCLILIGLFYEPESPVFTVFLVAIIGVEAWHLKVYFSQRTNLNNIKQAITIKKEQLDTENINFESSILKKNFELQKDIFEGCVWISKENIRKEVLDFLFSNNNLNKEIIAHISGKLLAELEKQYLELKCKIMLNGLFIIFGLIIGFILCIYFIPSLIHWKYQFLLNMNLINNTKECCRSC